MPKKGDTRTAKRPTASYAPYVAERRKRSVNVAAPRKTSTEATARRKTSHEVAEEVIPIQKLLKASNVVWQI